MHNHIFTAFKIEILLEKTPLYIQIFGLTQKRGMKILTYHFHITSSKFRDINVEILVVRENGKNNIKIYIYIYIKICRRNKRRFSESRGSTIDPPDSQIK